MRSLVPCLVLSVSIFATLSAQALAAKPIFCKNIAGIALREHKISSGFGEKVNSDFKMNYDEGLEPYEPKQSANFDNIQNYDAGRPASYTFKLNGSDALTVKINQKFGEKQESTIEVQDARNVRDNNYELMPDVYGYTVSLDHTCRIKEITINRYFDGEKSTESMNGLSCKASFEDMNKNLRSTAEKVCNLYKGYFAAYVDGKLLKPNTPKPSAASVADDSNAKSTDDDKSIASEKDRANSSLKKSRGVGQASRDKKNGRAPPSAADSCRAWDESGCSDRTAQPTK